MSDISKIKSFLSKGEYINKYKNREAVFAFVTWNNNMFFSINGFNFDYCGVRLKPNESPMRFVKSKNSINFISFVRRQFHCPNLKWVHLDDDTNSMHRIFKNGKFLLKNKISLIDYYSLYYPMPDNTFHRLFSCAEQKLERYKNGHIKIYTSRKPCDNCISLYGSNSFVYIN